MKARSFPIKTTKEILESNHSKKKIPLDSHFSTKQTERLSYALNLIRNPAYTYAYLHLNRFEDLSITNIGLRIRSLIIGVNKTLISDPNNGPSAEVINKLIELRRRYKICFYPEDPKSLHQVEILSLSEEPTPSTNRTIESRLMERPTSSTKTVQNQLIHPPQQQPIFFAKHITPKPDLRGFDTITRLYLEENDPTTCAVIGSDFTTDGGGRQLGMPFIYINPLNGPDTWYNRNLRNFGRRIATYHDEKRRRYLLEQEKIRAEMASEERS